MIPTRNQGDQNRIAGDPLSGLNPIEADPDVCNFLSENHYVILNNCGYPSLDELIDDNQEIFGYDFEKAVRKCLGLIYYSDDLKKLSTRKTRLKERLLKVFRGTKQLVASLSKDYSLLLKVFTIFFKGRIKFFTMSSGSVSLQIFGEKGCKFKVKVFYDSFLFYVLIKEKKPKQETLTVTYRDVTTEQNVEFNQKFNEEAIMPLVSDSLMQECNIILSDYQDSEDTVLFLIRELTFGFEFMNEKQKPKEPIDIGFISIEEIDNGSLDYGQLSLEFQVLEIEETARMNKASIDQINFLDFFDQEDEKETSLNWSNIFIILKGKGSVSVNKEYINTDQQLQGTENEFGILESYSCSRHCGFITTYTDLQVIVIKEELMAAGVPEVLLNSSAENLSVKLRFTLNELSSEPVAIFEAIKIMFLN